jgi:cell division GTPase FtsZ
MIHIPPILLVTILTGANVIIMTELNKFCEVSCLPTSFLKAEIDEIIWQMSHESQLIPIKVKEVEYLYEESVILKRRFHSLSEGVERRMDSIVREMKKFEPSDKKTYEHILILIQTSKEHPLIMSELQSLNDILEGFSSKAEIRWGLGINEQLEDNILIMIVCSKR